LNIIAPVNQYFSKPLRLKSPYRVRRLPSGQHYEWMVDLVLDGTTLPGTLTSHPPIFHIIVILQGRILHLCYFFPHPAHLPVPETVAAARLFN